ncbi:MAG: peptidyl-prolyl cis-trans isomerase, partial [Proteobacteria bacterium]|nr:peptidyl-prolyl cis-trans isomerase [Pseudomonadota bacterium]
ISEEELKEIYERDISSYTLPEQRALEQAILPDEGTARAVADAFDIKTGLKAAVEKATGKPEGYIGEETFMREGLPPAVAAEVFETEKSGITEPVKTALGWHVMAVTDIIEPRIKPFSGVRDEIRKDLMSQKLADQLYALAGEIDDRLAGGGTLEEVADAMQLKIRKFGPIRADGSTPDNREGLKDPEKDRNSILQTVFELAEGESAPVMELADGSFAALRVDRIDSKSYKPFDSVKADLRKVWIADQQEVLNKQRAQDILKSLASAEKTLEQAAKDADAAVQTFKIKRNENPPEVLSAPAKTKFFETPKGEYAVTAAKDGYIVGQVTKASLPDPAKISADDLKKTRETATQGSRDEHLLAYMQYLQNKAKVKINRRLLETTYGPGSGN